jgi:tetratricopeptide (TPR) repeat protein
MVICYYYTGSRDLFRKEQSTMAGVQTERKSTEPLSPSKRRAFVLICLSSPLILLIVVEVVLRFFNLGGYDAVLREIEETPRGKLVITEQAGTGGFFFANPGRPGYNNQYSFFHPKSTNTVRIALLGGSAIKGYPQTMNFCASAFLREMLEDCWPGREVEIINLGTTAVASFPVREMLKQMVEYDPDLVVIYSGHNEFFGAYGVASKNRAGTAPWMLKLQYRVRGLALMQGLNRLKLRLGGTMKKPLMEFMVGVDYVAPDSWRRRAAAHLLYTHISDMIRMCSLRNIPVIACTLPANERNLAPIGSDPRQPELDQALSRLRFTMPERPLEAISELEKLLLQWPDHALANYLYASALHLVEDYDKAQLHFIRARDLDPMPWRAPTRSQDAIRQAAKEGGAQLCDAEAAFRKASPGGVIGWELMDDHVHLSLEGQALLARTLVETLTNRTDALQVKAEVCRSLPEWTDYAKRLGDNDYERYAVAHTLRTIFNVSFMRDSNPDALKRFDRQARNYENQMPPELRRIAVEWQKVKPRAGGKQPISGLIARELLKRNQVEAAAFLFSVAHRSVPEYTSWHLEYVYFWLACRLQLAGSLSAEELALSAGELERGKTLLRHGYSESGFAARYVGRIHQLRDEYAEAIPYLLAARDKLYEFDKVAADQALVMSYLQTGDPASARKLAMYGTEHSGKYADYYHKMLKSIPAAGEEIMETR